MYTFFAVAAAGTAMIMDLRTEKIDNGWILFCLGISLSFRLTGKASGGVMEYLAGMVLPLIFPGFLFCFGMMGAGDIKLYCVLGSVIGPRRILSCIFFSLLIGGALSLAFLIDDGIFFKRMKYLMHYLQSMNSNGVHKKYREKGRYGEEIFHYSVPIFLSVLLYAGGVY